MINDKILKNMQKIKQVFERDYKNKHLAKKQVKDTSNNIDNIDKALKNGKNGGGILKMKGGKVLTRSMVKTGMFIFISVIATYFAGSIFASSEDFLNAIMVNATIIASIYAAFIVTFYSGITILVANDMVVCFLKVIRFHKSILDVLLRYIAGAQRMFEFNVNVFKFHGRMLIATSQAGVAATNYVLDFFTDVAYNSITLYERSKPELEIIVPDNLGAIPNLDELDNEN